MRITDFLTKQDIKVFLEGKDKTSIIEEMIAFLAEKHPELQPKKVLNKVLEREALETTGVGDGVAIPHARIDSLDEICVGLGLVENEADFKALDGKPAKIVFLILYPENEISLQIRFLARVSRLLHVDGLKKKLFACKTADEVYETLTYYEDTHFH